MIKEVVLVIGFPASGKTTIAQDFVFREYARLNRDTIGGSINNLVKLLKDFILSSEDLPGVVMDNTYPSIKSRAPVIKLCKEHNIPVKCIWLQTSADEALFNATSRMLNKYKDLLSPLDLKNSKDPNLFSPWVIYHYAKNYQKPTLEEGFAEIIEQPFIRINKITSNQKALILDFDGTLRDTKSGRNYPKKPDDVAIRPRVKETLEMYQKQGYLLLGASNQSGIAKGELTFKEADSCFEKTNELLGLKIDYLFCPHPSGAPSCYCRKPLPGMAIYFMNKYKLLPENMTMVGDFTSDETFANNCKMTYIHESVFFRELVHYPQPF